jgi:CBS domain-containing protein/uncharacterized protein (DUF2267 family)
MQESSNLNSFELGISRPVVVLKETEAIRNAASAMCRNDIGCVVVMGLEGQVAGIVTDRDITCRCVADAVPYHSKIAVIMEPGVISVSPSEGFEDVLRLMKEHGIRRIPVIEESSHGRQKCSGIFSLDHLIHKGLVSAEDYTEIIRAQVKLRKRRQHSRPFHEGRYEAIYEKFISNISKATGLDRRLAEELTHLILKTIVRRLHYTGSSQFISQLPSYLHEDLLSLPAGPDRQVTANVLVEKASALVEASDSETKGYISVFWHALCEQIGHGETGDVIDQLPMDFKDLLQHETKVHAV